MMNSSKGLYLIASMTAAVVAACYGGNAQETTATFPANGDDSGVPDPFGVEGGGPGATNGLPCDVHALLTSRCLSCHNTQSPRLRSYGELTAKSPSYPAQTVAARSLARMKASADPMPPVGEPVPSAGEIAVFEAWVNAGTPTGSCGVPDGGAADLDAAVVDPYNTPVTCTSKTTYTRGNGTQMHPGKACNSCHTQEREGPIYQFAGTVYASAHEPDDCNGLSAKIESVKVVVTDATGKTVEAIANNYGNFYYSSRTALTLPYKVKVVSSKGERVMAKLATSGDCNTCHTETGSDGAPGRVMAP